MRTIQFIHEEQDMTAEIKLANSRELVLTRVLNATPSQLFKA